MDGESKRATVMLLHGGSEDRLRQVIAQGLVSKEVQQDIEEVLAEAEDTRVFAETLQRQIEKLNSQNKYLDEELAKAEQQAKDDANFYAKAVAAYKREEKRSKNNADRKETFAIAALGALAFIAANVIGRLLFGTMFIN